VEVDSFTRRVEILISNTSLTLPIERKLLPAPLPEPGTLLIFSVMLGAAGLCRTLQMKWNLRKIR
jgi:hypothetical protein